MFFRKQLKLKIAVLFVGLIFIVFSCTEYITPIQYVGLGGFGSGGGSSSGSLGTGPDISDNLKPPSGGVTEDYLDDLEDFLDDTYDDVEDNEPSSPDATCSCGTGCTCSDPCPGKTGGTYTGSYNGYFKDAQGNKYFITKAKRHASSTLITGLSVLHVYYVYNSSNHDHTTIRYDGEIDDIDSVNGYFNFKGELYSQWWNNYHKVAGIANWRGYIENLSFDKKNSSVAGNNDRLIYLPNDTLPDINGVDQTPHSADQWNDNPHLGTSYAYVDGIKYTTYHAKDDGAGITYDENTGGDDGYITSDDTYFIFNLKKLPCGMDESLVTLITM